MLPLNDLQIIGNPKDFETFVAMEFHLPVPPSGQYTYYPGTSEIPERSAANVHNVSYKVLAEVELDAGHRRRHLRPRLALRRPRPVHQGRPGHLRLQLPRHPAREPHLGARADGSGTHIIGVEFTKERMGEYREGVGPLKLYIDDQLVGEDEIRTVMGHFSLCGEGLCIGYDSADAVSARCTPVGVRVHRRHDQEGRVRHRRRRLRRRRGPPRRGDGPRLNGRRLRATTPD